MGWWGLVAAAAAVAISGWLGAATARADAAELDITYNSPTSLSVKIAGGASVPSGSTIPAGSYNVIVYDAGVDMNPHFTMSGPGVSLSTDLDSTGMGIDQTAPFGPYTFQTSSTYQIEDTNSGASTLVTFNTSATSTASSGGGSSSSGGSGSSTGSSSSSTSSSSSKGSSKSSGSTTIGTLSASVSAAGKLTLTFGGKTVKSLKAGRYEIRVADHSMKAGVMLGSASTHPMTLSGAAAAGSTAKTVTLGKGKWFVEPTVHGPKTWISVL
jgi:hypothetical protein